MREVPERGARLRHLRTHAAALADGVQDGAVCFAWRRDAEHAREFCSGERTASLVAGVTHPRRNQTRGRRHGGAAESRVFSAVSSALNRVGSVAWMTLVRPPCT